MESCGQCAELWKAVQTPCKYKYASGKHGRMGFSAKRPSCEGMDLILQEWGLKYDKQALLASLTWFKNHRLDITEAATLDLRTWEWIGRFIIEATSIGDKASISVIEPWRFTVPRRRAGWALCGCAKR